MWPVVIGCVIGAALMGRTKPKTPVNKRELIGPNTGNIYLVDDFNRAGIIIVHGPGCVCVFARKSRPAGQAGSRPAGGGFAFVSAMGNHDGIRQVCSDLEPALLQQSVPSSQT